MTNGPSSREAAGIASEVRHFEPFAAALSDFFQQIEKERIFTEEPPEDSCGSVAAHLAEGRYRLKAFGYQMEKETCRETTFGLLKLMRRHLPAREADLARIEEVFSSGRQDPHAFILSVFRNRGDDVVEIVRRHELDLDLTVFFAVYLTRPFRHLAARHLCEDLDFSQWLRGYCPVCGHWPALARVEEDDEERTLWCLACGTAWPYPRSRCVLCGTQEAGGLSLFGPEGEPAYQVQACDGCGEYLKEVRAGGPAEDFPFDAYYLGTHALDQLAGERGYAQESPMVVETDHLSGNEQLLSHRMKRPRLR